MPPARNTKEAWCASVGHTVQIHQGRVRATAKHGDRVNVLVPNKGNMPGSWQSCEIWGHTAFSTEQEATEYARKRYHRETQRQLEEIARRKHVMREHLKGCPECGRALEARLSTDGKQTLQYACVPCARFYEREGDLTTP